MNEASDVIRAGIVGAGFIAEAHARGYAAQPDVRLTAIASRRLERAEGLARRYDAQAFTDFNALLEVVDVVSVCTPTPTHAEFAIAAMRAGKHVLCEKPIARTLAQAEAMLQATRASGTKLMVAQVGRYEADQRKAKDVLERGDLGQLRMAFQSITSPLPDWSSEGWLTDLTQSGGPVLDLAVHSFDYLLWLFGERAIRVHAVAHGADARQYAQVTLRFEGGGMGLVEVSWAHPHAEGLMARTELVGTHGRLSWDYDGIASMHIVQEDAGKNKLLMIGEDSFLTQAADFVRCVFDDLPPPISGEEGLAALRVSLAALESLETGQAVKL